MAPPKPPDPEARILMVLTSGEALRIRE
jgi:hypothetical protein